MSSAKTLPPAAATDCRRSRLSLPRAPPRSRKRRVLAASRAAFVALACGLLLAGGPVDAQVDASAAGTPRLVVPEDTYDWGEVLKEEEIVHTFVIRNDGTAPLLIKDIKKT